ncbi:MAG: DUF1592 domain-containing protein [Bryobacterales bacterium]
MRRFLWIPLLASATLAAEPDVQPFLDAYCVACHGAKTQMADRRFDDLSADLSDDAAREQWRDIVGRLNLGSMPPKGAPQPSDDERQAIVDWATPRLSASAAEAKSTGGKTVLRRLNRYEYDRTVRDLLSLQDLLADPTDVFPPDAVEQGFDNIGATLKTSDFLLTGYLSAAATYLDHAIAPAERPEMRRYVFQAPFCPTGNRHDGQDEPGRFQNIRKNTTDEGGFLWIEQFAQGVPQDGYYTLRIRAQGVNQHYPYDERLVGVRKSEPLRMAVVAGSAHYGELGLRTSSDREIASFDLTAEPEWYEARVWLDAGYQPRITFPNGPNGVKPLRRALVTEYSDTFLSFIRGYVVPEGPINKETLDESFTRRVSKEGASKTELTTAGTSRMFNRRDGWATFFEEYQGPRVRVYAIELEGPNFDQWPPAPHVALFGEHTPTVDNAEAILTRFATRAFRRPVETAEVAPLVALVRERRKKGDSESDALAVGLRAVLASPGFLYLNEGEGKLDDYALASRLSYFLWSSMPDEQLLEAARQGELRDPQKLRAQALRLLADPRAGALSEQFVSRWLELYKIGSMPPSAKDFDAYYVDGLESAMKTEARRFFRHALENNLPIEQFLDSDFTFVNGGLARLYGIPGVRGSEFRKVSLPDKRRGGLLGMAAVLTASANGIDTSPVVRGVWVLENILGTPPNPPPPDVEPIEPDIRGATTIRDQLVKHRAIPTCNACHQSIDPPGFALENFDPIGGWRDRYPRPNRPGPPIDSSGQLLSGEAFASITDFKQVLLESHRDEFARCLTSKLLLYASGRTLEPSDEPEIARIAEQPIGLRDLILAVVSSDSFRSN